MTTDPGGEPTGTLSVPWQFDAELQAIAFVTAALDSDSLDDEQRARIVRWAYGRWAFGAAASPGGTQ